ncbi:hypothetical protein ACWGTO_27880 [Mesorhizobium sp. PL10]
MSASRNFASSVIMKATGSILTHKYAEWDPLRVPVHSRFPASPTAKAA